VRDFQASAEKQKSADLTIRLFNNLLFLTQYFLWRYTPWWCRAPSLSRLHDHIQTHHTPLNEWSARRRELYLTTHNAHKIQTSMLRRDSNP